MKRTNFTQQGGFPLEEKTLDYMQTAYIRMLQAFIGHLNIPNVGNFILTGCEISGAAITPGMMYIDGELCPFIGDVGDGNTKIAKIETIEEAPFESGDNLETYYDYTAQINENGVAYSAFVRVPNVSQLVNVVPAWNTITGIPQDIVQDANYATMVSEIQEMKALLAPLKTGFSPIFWGRPANEIPPGFAEDTNWRGKMPVGLDISVNGLGNFVNPEFAPLTTGQNDPGREGGSKAKFISQANLPQNIKTIHVLQAGTTGGGGTGPEPWSPSNVNFGGIGAEMDVLNPYRTVLFIKWVGL